MDPATSTDRPAPPAGNLTAVVILAGPFVALALFLAADAFLTGRGPLVAGRDWEPIQVLGGADEAWMLLEVERSVQLPGLMTSRVLLDGDREQHVIRFDRTGVRSRTATRGPIFRPGESLAFHDGEDLHLLEVPQTGAPVSNHRWDGSRFVPASATAPAGTPVRTLLASLWDLSRRNGWKIVVQGGILDRGLRRRRLPRQRIGVFWWNGLEFGLETQRGPKTVAVHLVCRNGPAPWSEVVARFDATSEEVGRETFANLLAAAEQSRP